MSVVLRAPNTDLLVSGKAKTYLASAASAASGTLTVESILGFGVNNLLALGTIGDENSEIIRVHSATAPTGTTITLNANTTYAHAVGTPIYLIGFDQIEFSRATTTTGVKSVLATQAITLDQMESIYDDTTNSTGYGFWRWKNTVGTTYSDYSDYIPYAGYDAETAYTIFQRALSVAGEVINPRLLYSDLFNFLNDFIALANAENPRWSQTRVLDYTLDTIAAGDWEYTLPSDISRKFDPTTILNIHTRDYPPLRYVNQREWNKLTSTLTYTTAAVAIGAADVTITLTSSADFADSGSILVNGDTIAYTTNTRSTGVLSGVTGIITGGHAIGSYVFQNQITGAPQYYTFSASRTIRVWPIVSSVVENQLLYLDYYKAIPTVNSLGDSILISNIKAAIDYVAYRIKKHVMGGSLSVGDEDFQIFMQDFKTMVERDVTGEPLSIRVS